MKRLYSLENNLIFFVELSKNIFLISKLDYIRFSFISSDLNKFFKLAHQKYFVTLNLIVETPNGNSVSPNATEIFLIIVDDSQVPQPVLGIITDITI